MKKIVLASLVIFCQLWLNASSISVHNIPDTLTSIETYSNYGTVSVTIEYEYESLSESDSVSPGVKSGKPIVTAMTATNITSTSATLRARINPNGDVCAYLFQYGYTTSYGNNVGSGTLDLGNSNVTVTFNLTGLDPDETYHFRVRAGNNSGLTIGDDNSFTTLSDAGAPTATTLSATGITEDQATMRGSIDPNGSNTAWKFEYGTTTNYGEETSPTWVYASDGVKTVASTIIYLSPNTTYHYRLVAANSYGYNYGSDRTFTTSQSSNNPPTTPSYPSPSDGATGISLNPSLSWSCYDPEGGSVGYTLWWGTSPSNMPNSIGGTGTSASLSGLNGNQTYYWKVVAYDQQNNSTQGPIWHFTTGAPDCFYDCTSNNCGTYGNQMYTAAQHLCGLDIIEGINNNLEPDINITRAQLAKLALYGLYNGPSHVPNTLMSDYFPSIYPDLQNENTYYYRAAKALLYLEYGDGVSPFDRDRAVFNPTGNIERCLVLKVLLETFNITPLSSGTNVFDDYGPSGYTSSAFWGYAQKAYNLGIVQTTHFRPNEYCTRGEAFLYLYRILTNNSITKPTPNNTESPSSSDFFIPANLSPKVVNSKRGVEYGNFSYYNKDFFDIPGYIDLNFGVSYNSYLTEMPDDLYPVKPLGKAWTHTYDMYMNIVTDSYNNQSVLVFHMQDGSLLMYDQDLASMTEGNYYEMGQLGSNKYLLTSPDQISYTFQRLSTSDGIYYLTQIKDRNNNAIDISYSYGNSHYRISSVSTLGRTLNFYYTSGTDLLYYVKDPVNRYVYFYYTDGQLNSLKDAKNQTTYFTYGTSNAEKGLLTEITLPRGNKVYNNYQQRKLQSMRNVNNSNSYTHTAISISPNYQNGSSSSTVTTKLSSNQSITTNYTMNSKNRITNMNDDNHNVSYEYNISGKPDQVSKVTDNKNNIQTSYSYNNKGLPTSIAVSAGGSTHTTNITYTNLYDVESYTDAKGNTTNYTYTNGNLIRITDALGNQTNITYNSYGSPTRVTNPMGVYVDYSYNTYGNIVTVSIPSLNKSASMSYDNVSRLTSQTDFAAHTTSYAYDNNDNVITVTDAAGNTTTWNYDANDNVNWIQNALGKKTYMTYDNNDFLTQITFEGFTKSYSYNLDGSLSSFTDPNGHTFNYTYNSSGEMTSDGITTFGYNNSTGRLVSATKDGKSITYTYDAFGRTTSIAYDGKTVSYTYDNNGNVISITYPGNKTVTYTYDALNRMTSTKDWNNATTNYYYRNDGQLDYYQYPNGVRTTYSYDNAGRCNGFRSKRNNGNGSAIAEYSFGFDAVDNHTSETITEPFTTYLSVPSDNVTYSYNTANRLTTAGNLSFGYDNNGNTVSRAGRTYNYDVLNNLTSVSGDFSASYTYDGLGNRRSATRNGVSTKYVLNLLAQSASILMETDANGTAKNYYIYGASGLISRIDANNNTRYYVYDYRGSTVAMTDATSSANITHKYQYDDFGKILQSEEADANLFRYVGRYGVVYEDEVLSFMRARYYDPEIGRFLSEDPIWSANLYPYAANNPIMGIDPNGEFVLTALAATAIYCGVTAFCFYEFATPFISTIAISVRVARGDIDYDPSLGIAYGGDIATISGLSDWKYLFWDVPKTELLEIVDDIRNVQSYKNAKKESTQSARVEKETTFQHDQEVLMWMRTSSDPYAEKLKTKWQIINRHPDLSESKKDEMRGILLKNARAYMNGNK